MRRFFSARAKILDSSIALTNPYTKVIPYKNSEFGEDKIRYWFKKSHAQPSPLVIFLHGLGCSKLDFADALIRLPHYNLLALDFPLCGRSDEFTQDQLDCLFQNHSYTLSDLATFAHDAIWSIICEENIPISKYFLAGHSMGAKIGVICASKHSNELYGFVNIEGHLHRDDPKLASLLLDQYNADDGFKHIIELISKGDDYWANSIDRKSSSVSFYLYAQAIRNQHMTEPDVLWDKFLALSTPLFYMYGEHSASKVKQSIGILSARNMVTREIHNASHFVFIDNPCMFYSELDIWIGNIMNENQ